MTRKRPDWIQALLPDSALSAQEYVLACSNRALIYRITSPTGQCYIGATNDLVYRLSQHRYGDYAIGRSIRSHGLAEHRIEVLMVGGTEHVFDCEKALVACGPGSLNLTEGGRRGGGHTRKGLARSVESRMRMSKKMKGRPCNATPESRKKQADSLQRFWSNPLNRERMIAARRGVLAAA